MYEDISGAALLKVYQLGSQSDLKENQTRLLKLVFQYQWKGHGGST